MRAWLCAQHWPGRDMSSRRLGWMKEGGQAGGGGGPDKEPGGGNTGAGSFCTGLGQFREVADRPSCVRGGHLLGPVQQEASNGITHMPTCRWH